MIRKIDCFHSPSLTYHIMSSILKDTRNTREVIENPQKELNAQVERQVLRLVELQAGTQHLKLERSELEILGESLDHNDNNALTG